MISDIKPNGVFLLNTTWDMEGIEKNLPAYAKRYIAENNILFYTINGVKIGEETGMGTRINTILQSAFFKLANIITFEAHDVRVQNAIPHVGFENGVAYYQFAKAMLKDIPDIRFDKEHMMVVSPDEGGVNRNLFYASIFGLDMGVFYKVRDFSRLENGRNPILKHEFIGLDVEGKDIIVVDDILSSGESMLDVAYELKRRKARRVFCLVTYALFTNGLEKFDKCYADNVLDGVFATNLTYRRPELKNKPWFYEVDMTKYVAKIIDGINYDESLANLINPAQRVINLYEKIKKGEKI
jgi:ribose-phosphate pyrophosphokinase